MKKLISILLALIIVFSTIPMVMAAEPDIASGTAGDGITWVINSDGVLTISGTGEIVVGWYDPPWAAQAEEITACVVGEGITKIPETAFYKSKNMTSLSLPSTLTEFKTQNTPLWSCDSIEEIAVAESNTNYKSIDGILFTEDEKTVVAYPCAKDAVDYTLPVSVTTIADNAFRGAQFNNLVIPDTVLTLGDYSFCMVNFETITLGSGVTELPSSVFSSAYFTSFTIPDTVKIIGKNAFYGCSDLETLIIGSGVEEIGDDAFYATYSLPTIHYKGNETQWDAINIHSKSEQLESTEIHYLSNESLKEQIAPSCKEGREEGFFCASCEEYIIGGAEIPAIEEHSWDQNYTCGKCGYTCDHYELDEKKFDEVCDYCDVAIPFDTVTLHTPYTVHYRGIDNKHYTKFVPTESGDYIVITDCKDEELDYIDPYVYVYNSEKELLAENDDGNEGLESACQFVATAGKVYYIAVEARTSNCEFNYTVKKDVRIVDETTASVLEINVNYSDMVQSYQWYEVEYTEKIIDDTVAEVANYESNTSSYDSEKGWTGVYTGMNFYEYFKMNLKTDEIVSIEIFGDNYYAGELVPSGAMSRSIQPLSGKPCYDFVAPEDGDYTLNVLSEESLSERITVKATHKIPKITTLEGETAARLKNSKINAYYFCEVKLKSGEVLKSNVFKNKYAVITQPTSEKPAVELNDDKDAKYQWYSAKINRVQITDENASVVSPFGDATSSYNENEGWKGVHYPGSNETGFFELDLTKNQTVKISINEDGTRLCVWGPKGPVFDTRAKANEEIAFSAPKDGRYVVCAFCTPNARISAYIEGIEYTKIDGATKAMYPAEKTGYYSCEVTFADGTTEMSNHYAGPHLHTLGNEWQSDKCNHSKECSVCQKSVSEKHVPKTANKKEATETQKGYTGDVVCETCGYEIAKGEEIPVKSAGEKSPPTGDNSNVTLLFVLFLISGGSALTLTAFGKNKNSKKQN